MTTQRDLIPVTGRKSANDYRLQADRLRLAKAEGRPCTGLTADYAEEWFPPENNRGAKDRASRAVLRAQARQLCAGCPVTALCLDVALRGEEWYGVWGGTSEHDRRQLIRDRRRTSQAAA